MSVPRQFQYTTGLSPYVAYINSAGQAWDANGSGALGTIGTTGSPWISGFQIVPAIETGVGTGVYGWIVPPNLPNSDWEECFYIETVTGTPNRPADFLAARGRYIGSGSAEILDSALVDGVTIAKALQRIGATAAGLIVDAGTETEAFAGLDGATIRVTFTVDANGNRTAVVYNDA